MKFNISQKLSFATIILALSQQASADFLERLDGQAYYDTESNLTWLVDGAAIFGTSYDWNSSGLSTWRNAMQWADNLTVGGYSDWRLPSIKPLNGTSLNTSRSHDGSTDIGNNISRAGTIYAGNKSNEIAYLYYNTLNNKPTEYIQDTVEGYPRTSHFQNSGPFVNLNPADTIWTNRFERSIPWFDDTELEIVWKFNLYTGAQTTEIASELGRAIAVREGDINENIKDVPEPPILLLIGTILLSMLGMKKRRKA